MAAVSLCRKADHSPPYNDDVTNAWSHTSIKENGTGISLSLLSTLMKTNMGHEVETPRMLNRGPKLGWKYVMFNWSTFVFTTWAVPPSNPRCANIHTTLQRNICFPGKKINRALALRAGSISIYTPPAESRWSRPSIPIWHGCRLVQLEQWTRKDNDLCV
jgi:hypothetical protein